MKLFFSKSGKATSDDGAELTVEQLNKALLESNEALKAKDEALKAKDEALKQSNLKMENLKRTEKFQNYAKKLGVENSLEGVDFDSEDDTSIYEKLLDAHCENLENIKDAFEVTSSEHAGVTPIEDSEDSQKPELKDFNEAIKFISKRDGVSFNEASLMAQKEFPKLFDKLFPEEDADDTEE